MATKTTDQAAAEARSTDPATETDKAATEGAAGIADTTTEGTTPDTDVEQSSSPQTVQSGAESAESAESEEGAEGEESAGAEAGADADADAETGSDQDDAAAAPAVGQGAGAVLAAGLGVVSLTGSWVGTVAAARQSLIGQLETAQSTGVAKQVQSIYGDSWSITAVIGGVFALAALVVGAVVLAKPFFGVPGRSQAPWIKSVAWAGVALGVVGLLLAVAKYSGLLFGLPSTSS